MSIRFRPPRMLLTLSIIVAGTWAGFAGLLYLLQDQLIFHPSNRLASVPSAIGLPYEDVSLETADGKRLHGWYIPAENATGVLLFLHGNAGNISHRMASLEIFNRLGLSTLIIDYRGYGDSQGKPSEQGMYADAETAWNHLTMERGHNPGDIIIFGRSLGGAVAAWLAARVEPAGVILESAFTSLKALAQEYYPYIPVSLLLRSQYPTIDYMAAINAPTLLIHSREDNLIPHQHAELLRQAGGDSVQLHTINGGHNNGFVASGNYYTRIIRQFMDKVLA